MNLIQAFVGNSGSPYEMQSERHKWEDPMRLIIAMFIWMADTAVVMMKCL